MTDSPNPFKPGVEVALCNGDTFERVVVRSVFKNCNFTLVDRGAQQYHPYKGYDGWKAWQTGDGRRSPHVAEITPELLERFAMIDRRNRMRRATYNIDRLSRNYEPSEAFVSALESLADQIAKALPL